MLEPLVILISILVTIVATYFDIKTGEIPKELTLGLIGISLSLKWLDSALIYNPKPIMVASLAFIASYLIFWILWRFGVIAGGDAKLLIGLSTALAPFGKTFLPFIILPGVPIMYNGILTVTPFLLLLAAARLGKGVFGILKRNAKKALGFSFLSFACFGFFSWPLSLMLFLLFSFFPAKHILFVVPAFLLILKEGLPGILELITYFLGFFMLWSFFDMLLFSRAGFRHEKLVSQLEEGDILAEIIIDGGRKQPSITNYLLALVEKDKSVLPLSRGVEKDEIALLKKWGIERVMVQERIPFTPIILLGLLVSISVGDLIWLVAK